MVMPLLSVTLIGLAMAAGVIAWRRDGLVTALLYGVAGAWLGFIVCGVPGLLIDVALGDGKFVAILGHLGAVCGAAFALTRLQARGELAGRRAG